MSEDPKNRQFVRNETHKSEGGGFSLFHAFSCAGQGVLYTLRSQRNFRIQIAIAVLAIVLGIALRISFFGWIALFVCMGMVLAMECVNTAVESVVDLVSPEYALLAKRAKDSAAAAVLVSSLIALLVGLAVYVEALIRLFAL